VELTDVEGFLGATLVEFIAGVWAPPAANFTQAQSIGIDMGSDAIVAAAGGARVWIEEEFVPWLNDLLVTIYPAQEINPATPPAGSMIDQIDSMLAQVVRMVSKPDGTLVVEVVR
jgi:hypothetical protein